MICTWKGCEAEGVKEQVGKNGKVWAVLCPDHDAELGAACATMDGRKMLGAWVRAGYGHESRESFKRRLVEGTAAILRALKPGA